MSAALASGSRCTVLIAGNRVGAYVRSVAGTGATATVRIDTGEVAEVPLTALGAPRKEARS